MATTVGTISLAFLWEPADWAMTFNEWRQGHFSPLDLLGLLPILSSRIGDVGDALHFADKAGVDESSVIIYLEAKQTQAT